MRIQRIAPDDLALMDGMLDAFAEGFEDPEHYSSRRPSPEYQRKLLASDTFIALAALEGDRVVGALAAYELVKSELERSELYIYDLAVLESHRRRGIATALIAELGEEAKRRGAWVIYVQADLGDPPAIALYTGLGHREDVLHFDIEVPG